MHLQTVGHSTIGQGDFDGDFNPVYIEKVRKHIAKNISNVIGGFRGTFLRLRMHLSILLSTYAFGSGATNSSFRLIWHGTSVF